MTGLLPPCEASAPALIDADRGISITHGELRERAAAASATMASGADAGLVFLLATNGVDAITAYLACLASRRPVALLDAALAGPRLDALVEAYRPVALLAPAAAAPATSAASTPLGDGSGFALHALRGPAAALHPHLALLLTTSGSTGNPKFVRLSLDNLLANARSIAHYLGIGPGERGMLSLPMHYSYGLSVLNSHLAAGAAVVLSRHSFLRPEFWRAVDGGASTSFAGVPYAWETLHRLRFDPARHPTLRTMTQAGGALRPELVRDFHDKATRSGRRFFVMYGQTEATARIAYVPAERLGEKIGSIGIAIPGGELTLASVEGTERHELVYRGPNVMLGYAQGAADLADGDRLSGTLRTGDLARADGDGFFHLTGRLSRFAKLFGRRINLEDVERELEANFAVHAAVVEGGERLVLHVAAAGDAAFDDAALLRHLAAWLSVPAQSLRVQPHAQLPMTSSGKKDYRALQG